MSQQRNMLGDNPERSFLGKFGLGSKPNSNFFYVGGLNHHVVPWWYKDTKNILSNLSFYRFFSVTYVV
mgnify:CR=1 FL=1